MSHSPPAVPSGAPTGEVARRSRVGGGASDPETPSEPTAEPPPSPAEIWPRVRQLAGPRLGAMLDMMTLRDSTPRLLTLAVPQARAAMARDHLEEITRLVQQTGARGVSISIVETKPEPAAKADDASPGAPQTNAPAVDASHAEDHPLVREAARVFGAKVVHVQPKQPGPGANP